MPLRCKDLSLSSIVGMMTPLALWKMVFRKIEYVFAASASYFFMFEVKTCHTFSSPSCLLLPIVFSPLKSLFLLLLIISFNL